MRAGWLALLIGWVLVGCATPGRTSKLLHAEQVNAAEWQGRLSVQVSGDAPSSMSASFVLHGDAQNGELDLYSPLGTTLGALQWTPQWVQLSDGGKRQYFNSLAELTEKTTGVALPVEALFAWLEGRDLPAVGWQADLSQLSQGTLTAKRHTPAPEVTLRVKLDR